MRFTSYMHDECFYHGEYAINELDIDFEEVARDIEIVKRIAGNNHK